MSARMQTLRRPGRISELDPFGVEAGVGPGVDYGCVDWYVYGEEESADRPAPQAQPKIATAGRALFLPSETQARAQPH